MSKNLVDQFNLFCKKKNFENNFNQIQLIKTLQQFYNDNFKFSIKKFFLYKKLIITKSINARLLSA